MPVFVQQPVIIRKIPVIHKKKEVTIKKEKPIVVFDEKKPTTVEKGVIGEPDLQMKGMADKDLMPSIMYDVKRMPAQEEKVDMEIGGGMEPIEKMLDKDMMMEKKVDKEDDKFTDFDPKEFDLGKLTKMDM